MCGGSPDEIMRVEKVLVDVGQTPLCQGYILVVGTNDPTNKRTNWIWTSKRIGLKIQA